MKTNILYQSSHGTTERLAHMLSDVIQGKTKVYRIDQSNPEEMINADRIIIGGSIHAGEIQKAVSRFCKQYENQLREKETGLFICCLLKEQEQEEFYNAFPTELIKDAKAHGIFGGEIVFKNLNLFEKFLTRVFAKIKQDVSTISYDKVDLFVQEMEA